MTYALVLHYVSYMYNVSKQKNMLHEVCDSYLNT